MSIMDFDKLREKPIKIGNDNKNGFLPENAGCLPLPVVITTTVYENNPHLPGRDTFLKSFTIFAELARCLPKCIPTSHEDF